MTRFNFVMVKVNANNEFSNGKQLVMVSSHGMHHLQITTVFQCHTIKSRHMSMKVGWLIKFYFGMLKKCNK